jgi:hypothetical protein
MSISDLPPEIITAIIEASLADVEILIAASLINRPWHIISRRLLFEHISLLPQKPDRVSTFLNLFDSPYNTMVEYTRGLTVGTLSTDAPSTISCAVLERVAGAVIRLEHLQHTTFRSMDFATTSVPLLLPFQKITVLTLDHAKFSDLPQFVDVIFSFPTLVELLLIQVAMITNMNAVPSDTSLRGRGVPVTLRKFTMVSSRFSVAESLLEWLSGSDLPLEHLVLRGSGFRLTKSLHRLLQAAGSHLHFLLLHPTSGPFYPGWNNPGEFISKSHVFLTYLSCIHRFCTRSPGSTV